MPHPPVLTSDALTYQIPVQFGMVYWVNFGYPSLPEGIEEKRYQEAEKEIARVGKALQDYAGAIDEAAAALEKAGK